MIAPGKLEARGCFGEQRQGVRLPFAQAVDGPGAPLKDALGVPEPLQLFANLFLFSRFGIGLGDFGNLKTEHVELPRPVAKGGSEGLEFPLDLRQTAVAFAEGSQRFLSGGFQ